jgi:hypothetical protein
MRSDPLFLLWVVNCPSPEEAHSLQQWLPTAISADTTFVDEVRACPDGVETATFQSHHLGDYFESVRVVPGAREAPSTFGLLFQRRASAGRFWKDFMTRLLQSVRSAATGTTTTLAYRGDKEPATEVVNAPQPGGSPPLGG